MAKVRVFEAAKTYGYEVQDLLSALVRLGVKVRSHLSPVEEEEIRKAVETLGGTPKEEAAEAAPKPRSVVRRRKKAEPEVATAPEVAEEVPAVAEAEVVTEGEPPPAPAEERLPEAPSDEVAVAVEATAAAEAPPQAEEAAPAPTPVEEP